MRHLVFVSHRTGRAELFLELRDSGQLLQLTDHEGLAEFSITPSHDGRYVYFTDGQGAWRRGGPKPARKSSWFLSPPRPCAKKAWSQRRWGRRHLVTTMRGGRLPVKMGDVARLVVIDTCSGASEVIVERDSIGHPEFHPNDSSLLRYAGPYYERMWVVNRDGSDHRLAYVREGNEWIVHETWHPRKRELLTTRWPHGVIGVDVDTGDVRPVCSFNAWHPMVSRDGARMVADTTFPDSGLQVFDPTTTGLVRRNCSAGHSRATRANTGILTTVRTTTARSRSMRRSTRIRIRIFRRMGATWSLRRIGVGGRRCTSVGCRTSCVKVYRRGK